MVVLAGSALWWALVQLQRAGLPLQLTFAVPPSLVHAAVMTFGFIPLFFAGFLFTAGPRWLDVPPPGVAQVRAALLAQAAGWLLWLAGAHVHSLVALTGMAIAIAGLAATTVRFAGMVRASRVPDRMHASVIAWSLAAGCVCAIGAWVAAAVGEFPFARAFVVTGLWTCMVTVYVAVAHRMIPFFTTGALPMLEAWRPGWILALMLAMAVFEGAAVWIDMLLWDAAPWQALRGALEVAAGLVLVWLAFAWGLAKSLRIRLLAMLHLGFLWLGLALSLAGGAHLVGALAGEAVLPLAGLHALTMGCLGSLMLAMVTRVSCGHSGRPLVADNLVWSLFWILQAAVVLRLAAELHTAVPHLLLAAAALLWAAVMLAWGIRYGNWYGRARADGRPG